MHDKTAHFKQVLIAPDGAVPDGRFFGEEHMYAVSYQDGSFRIPYHCRLELSPRLTTDMHGNSRKSLMAKASDDLTDMDIVGDHQVTWVADAHPRIIQQIHPRIEFRYAADVPLRAHHAQFRKELLQVISAQGKLPLPAGYKHFISLSSADSSREMFRYQLPMGIPQHLISTLKDLEVQCGEATVRFHELQENVLPFRHKLMKDREGIVSTFVPYRLHQEQAYLQPYLGDGTASLLQLDTPSRTCEEKLAILNDRSGDWTIDNIMSAQFYETDTSDRRYVVLVGPHIGKIPDKEAIIQQHAGITAQRTKEAIPEGMESGTCTPCMYHRTGQQLHRIIFFGLPQRLMESPGDYSIGGYGPSAIRASLQTAPKLVRQILEREFSGKVVTCEHPLYST